MVTIKPEDKEEFIKYFLQTVELTKKIYPHLSHLKDSGDKEGYSKRFRELLKIEREKLNQNEKWKNDWRNKIWWKCMEWIEWRLKSGGRTWDYPWLKSLLTPNTLEKRIWLNGRILWLEVVVKFKGYQNGNSIIPW